MMLNAAALVEECRRQRESLLAAFPELADDETALADTLEGITSITDTIAGYIRSALDDDALADALATRIKDMGERKGRLSARAERRRAIALSLMRAADIKRVERDDFTVGVGWAQRAVVVTDETLLTDDYVRTTREPNKVAIKNAIGAGKTVPGAMLNNGHPTLSVRTK